MDSNSDFLEYIKIREDEDKQLLVKIQSLISKYGVNKKNIAKVTKELTKEQKDKLKQLYQKQIETLKNDILTCKNKILKIKKEMA